MTQLLNELQTCVSIAKEKGKEGEANIVETKPSTSSNKNRKRKKKIRGSLKEALSPRRTRAQTTRKVPRKRSPKENVSTAV